MGKKKKVILPPELPPEVADEEIEVSDEDFYFVKENKKFAGFLSKIDTKSIDKHVNRVADHKEDELEALYEKRNRKAALKKPKEEDGLQVDRVDALPIKTLDGELQYRTAKKLSSIEIPNKDAASEVNGDDEDKSLVRLTKAERRLKLKKSRKEAKKQNKEEVKEDPVEGSLHSEVLAKVEEDLSAEELFARKKIRLAEIGMTLIENPESSIKSLKELLQICNDEDHNIVKLGLMSLLAVFKDIIPGYRIRLPTEKELEMTVSKAVRQTRFYESTLLQSYKDYLLRLMALEKQTLYHRVAVRCLCNLLDAVPHFNFRQSLLAGVIKNISSTDDVVRKLCCEAIKSLFTNEGKHGGEATLEAVRLIADQVKNHDCQLHPDSLNVFLSLTFDEDLGKSEPKENEKDKFKKRNWKKHEESNQLKGSDAKKSRQELLAKTREEVSADFKAVSFAPDKSERRGMQSDTLSAVFETYFRILKRSMDLSISRLKPASISLSGGFGTHPLLAPCLNGLGKFSHLIDLDFMGDLMMCLKRLAGYSENHNGSPQNCLSVSERLQCCIVAFRVMRSNLDALNVDLQEFFVQLYNLLLEYRPGRDHGDVLAEALKTMLWEGKQHDMQRAAAFIKRLATFALNFGSAEAISALVTLKHLLQKNSKCRCLLENDAGGGSLSGLVVKYQPDASDPNLSGALASVLWELSLLSKHYNPTISSMASSISSMETMTPSQNQAYLSTISPVQAFRDLSVEQELSKPIGKPLTPNRKRKRDQHSDVASGHERVWEIECSVDEDEIKNKLENHFQVLRDIEENERLRAELNRTMKSISLYEEYKQQKKPKKGSAVSKKK
ncbi:nucleolar complex protein 3-like protein [Iris pallida]|uniref:Nucleolar complex protein 3-like protein n=1 Tax=Iris pallida TaxID=29817 RepID=A0AAX6EWJ8_IRIPA|nr:nucleolar complex protein 3-like protein [Iris pallida]